MYLVFICFHCNKAQMTQINTNKIEDKKFKCLRCFKTVSKSKTPVIGIFTHPTSAKTLANEVNINNIKFIKLDNKEVLKELGRDFLYNESADIDRYIKKIKRTKKDIIKEFLGSRNEFNENDFFCLLLNVGICKNNDECEKELNLLNINGDIIMKDHSNWKIV